MHGTKRIPTFTTPSGAWPPWRNCVASGNRAGRRAAKLRKNSLGVLCRAQDAGKAIANDEACGMLYEHLVRVSLFGVHWLRGRHDKFGAAGTKIAAGGAGR